MPVIMDTLYFISCVIFLGTVADLIRFTYNSGELFWRTLLVLMSLYVGIVSGCGRALGDLHRTSQPHFLPSTPNPSPPPPPPPPRSLPAALALSILRPRHGVSPLPARLRLLQFISTTVAGPPPFRVIHLPQISQRSPAEMARRRAKIARIDDGVETFCFMLGAISGLYLFVLALSNFSPLDPKLLTPPATNQASSSRWPANQCPIGLVCSLPGASTSARSDQLKNDIAMWNRLLVSFFLAAVFTILPVRQLVSAAAKAEARAASEEDKAYKTVAEKKKAAVDAARAADEELFPTGQPMPTAGRKQSEVLRRFETAFNEMEVEIKEAKRKRPLVGIARMGNVERRIVRSLFVFAILCSIGMGICAAVAFFKSLQLQMHDPVTFTTIVMFILPGFPFVIAHLHFLYEAIWED